MNFKKSTQQEADEKYGIMLNGGICPYQDTPSFSSLNTIEAKFEAYHKRLSNEQISYNNALNKIKSTRQHRLQQEEKARQEKEARRQARNERNKQIGITLAVISPVLLLLIWAYVMLKSPLIAFKHIHFGWAIAIYVVAFLACIASAIFLFGEHKHRKVLLSLGSIVFLVLMIVGMTSTDSQIIEISSVREFETIVNIPKAAKCHYLLTNDIDFEGNSSETYGSIKTFNGVFDGNGYYIKNLNVSKESVSYRGANESGATPELMGFVLYNRGEIKNLGFENCTFEAFVSGENTNSFGILAGQNAGQIDNCVFIDTYIKCYHHHDYYSKKYNVLNCDDDFGYIVGRNAIGDRATYSNTRVYGKITNIEVRFETENQEFLSKSPSGNYDNDNIYILNKISGDENISVIDEIGFTE